MKELFNLIPAGWTFRITYEKEHNLFRITILDNIGAGNDILITPECINSISDMALKETIEAAKQQINKLYNL